MNFPLIWMVLAELLVELITPKFGAVLTPLFGALYEVLGCPQIARFSALNASKVNLAA